MKEELATITVQIPEATRRRLKVLAAASGQPVRALVAGQIDRLLANSNQTNPGSDHAPPKT